MIHYTENKPESGPFKRDLVKIEEMERHSVESATRSDRLEIRRAVSLLYRPGEVELRVPKTGREGTISGYFSDFEKLVEAALALDGRGLGVYVTLNPVKPALLARAHNRV